MQKKIHALKRPKFTSLRPVLIYEGELSDDVKESCFFDKLVCVGDFMKANDD
jgi:hypothetical protein